MRIEAVLKALGRGVYYHAGLAKHFGGVNPALFFSQIHYWQDKTDHPLGVYKTAEKLRDEIGMSYREQLSARDALKRLGVLVETHKRLEHRLYFRIDYDALEALIAGCVIEDSRNAESAIRDETKAQPVNKKKESTHTNADCSALFDVFWKAYPSKVGKDAARKAFAKRKFDEKTFAQVLQALELQKVSERWTKDNGKYIPNPATWLNQGRWEDEVPGTTPGSANTAFAGII